MLATIASVITIVGGVFDYGPRTARDAHSWVDSWARASGAHTWALWIMIVAACAGLILMMHTTWLGEHVEERVQLITSTGLLLSFLLPIWLVLGWPAFPECDGGFVAALITGGLIGSLFRRMTRPRESADVSSSQFAESANGTPGPFPGA